ncbi:NUDIX hydrolase [Sulfuricurvum sp.]|uniref:NUDIX hydrolase n=1 Tax=Sulfuricurvum sp. TaxID=2025608 RepID=UPI002D40AEF4|nr:NUDIX hydrolase [Sulfuricurvum sp.]HZF70419.1 NUDIX hydrolase [Sulfuricurvum sp.]
MSNSEINDYLELMNDRPELFVNNDVIRIETDPEIINNFMNETGKKIGVIYKSEFNMLLVDLIKEYDGSMSTYERIVPTVTSGAVVVIPIFQSKFVLLKQYRHSIRNIQYAFPRGYGEPDISSEKNVQKEIKEEIGAELLSIKYLGDVIADSGLSGNTVKIYIAEVTEPKIKKFDEGILDLIQLSRNELEIWIKEEKVTDGFTLSAYCLYSIADKD